MKDNIETRLEQALFGRGEGLAVGLGFTLGDYVGLAEVAVRAVATLTTAPGQAPERLPPTGIVLFHPGVLHDAGATPFRLAWFLGESLRTLIAEVAGGAEALEDRVTNLARELADVVASDAFTLEDSHAVVTDDCWSQFAADPAPGTVTWLRFELEGLPIGTQDLWLAYPTPVVERMLAPGAQPDPTAPAAALLGPMPRPEGIAPVPANAPTSRDTLHPSAPNVRRLLRTNVPIIVTLADKRLPTSRLVDIGPGSIIEFERPCDEPLQLSANNLPIGVGEAVKIGDHFGLKVTAILTPEQRAQRLAGKSWPS